MKARITISFLALLLLNSCIIKSLFPFYTKDTVYFEKSFIGSWKDKDKGKWEVNSFKDEFFKTNIKHKISELSEEDLNIYNKYKEGYYIKYSEENRNTHFIGMPFKIKGQLFIDFSIIEIGNLDISLLTAFHLATVHSFAKLDILSNESISIKWFDEEKMKNLLDENKIRIKYEKIGFENSYLLTASTEELQKFIKKLMASKDKWSTEIEYDLIRINDKP